MKNLLTLSIIIIFGLFSLPAARSQENTQILLTWQANNFYPADYQGKPLATPNSRITVALEILKNNKFLNLNQANVFWLLDDKPIDNGRGLKEIGFVVKKQEGDNHVVRVTVQLENQKLESLILVPGVGFEPTNPFESRILSPLRKPFRHPGINKFKM